MADSPMCRITTEQERNGITLVKQQVWRVNASGVDGSPGRWRRLPIRSSPWRVRLAVALLLTIAPAAASAAGALLYARGSWAALDRGALCEALGRSERVAAKGKVQALAGFAFSADRRRWGEFHARLSRVPRAGATVMLEIGGQPFLLVSRGQHAWSRGPAQDQAIIAALRQAPAMRVQSRDRAGRRFSDRYLLDGAPTAIDSAAARCAGKSARP